jgi:hypothetical protein
VLRCSWTKKLSWKVSNKNKLNAKWRGNSAKDDTNCWDCYERVHASGVNFFQE